MNKKYTSVIILIVFITVSIFLLQKSNDKIKEKNIELPILKKILVGENYLGLELNLKGGMNYEGKEISDGFKSANYNDIMDDEGNLIDEEFVDYTIYKYEKLYILNLEKQSKILIFACPGQCDIFLLNKETKKLSERIVVGNVLTDRQPIQILGISTEGRYLALFGDDDSGVFSVLDIKNEKKMGDERSTDLEKIDNFKFIDNENFQADFIYDKDSNNKIEKVVGDVNTYFEDKYCGKKEPDYKCERRIN